jgi:hypothetical protein
MTDPRTEDPNQSPQAVLFQKWKRESPFVPHSWEDHKLTFDAAFEAGVRYAFSQMAESMLSKS